MIQEAHPLKQGLKLVHEESGENVNAIQEAHPLKQGLKHIYFHFHFFSLLIQEAHPLKQGLKHCNKATAVTISEYSRGTSTKTRIETVA